MKTLFVGDIHCQTDKVLSKVNKVIKDDKQIQRVVFLGDYMDNWDSSDDDCINCLIALKSWKDLHKLLRIDFLVGNHDYAYLFSSAMCSGHHYRIDKQYVKSLLVDDLDIKYSTVISNILATHAGVTKNWMDCHNLPIGNTANDVCNVLDKLWSKFINDYLYKDDDKDVELAYILNECDKYRGGLDEFASPLWCDSFDLELNALGVNQVVGHSPVKCVERFIYSNGVNIAVDPKFKNFKMLPKSNETSVFLCDTFSTYANGADFGNGSMLVFDDATCEFKAINN